MSETTLDATPMATETAKTAVKKDINVINNTPTEAIPPEQEPSSRETLDKKTEEVSNADMEEGPGITNNSTVNDKAEGALRITDLEMGGGLDTKKMEEIADLSDSAPILTPRKKPESELEEPGIYAQNLPFEIFMGTGIKAKVDGSAIEEVQGGNKNESEPKIVSSCQIGTQITNIDDSKDEPTEEATLERKMADIVLEGRKGDDEGCRSFESEAPAVEFQERIRRPYGSRQGRLWLE